MTMSQIIRKTAIVLLERFAPGETSEYQQGPNTLGTKHRVWNLLPVPDDS